MLSSTPKAFFKSLYRLDMDSPTKNNAFFNSLNGADLLILYDESPTNNNFVINSFYYMEVIW